MIIIYFHREIHNLEFVYYSSGHLCNRRMKASEDINIFCRPKEKRRQLFSLIAQPFGLVYSHIIYL